MQSFSICVFQIVTIFLDEVLIRSDIEVHAVNEWKISIPWTYINFQKLSWTNWTPLVWITRVNETSEESFSIIRLRIALCPFLLDPFLDIPDVRLDRAKLNWNICFWLSRQEERLNWTASWRKSMKVKIDVSKPSVWLWQWALCLWPALTERKETINWTAGTFEKILQCVPVFGFNSAK